MSNPCLVCHVFCKIYQEVMMDFITDCIYLYSWAAEKGLALEQYPATKHWHTVNVFSSDLETFSLKFTNVLGKGKRQLTLIGERAFYLLAFNNKPEACSLMEFREQALLFLKSPFIIRFSPQGVCFAPNYIIGVLPGFWKNRVWIADLQVCVCVMGLC